MSKNFIQDGVVMEYANSGSAIEAGAVVVIGGEKIGVALEDIPATSGKGSVALEGVYELPKKASLAITQGDICWWDTTPGEITKTDGDGVRAGICFKTVAGSATTVQVKLFADRSA